MSRSGKYPYQDTTESRKRNKAYQDKLKEKAIVAQQNSELADKCCLFFGCGKKLTAMENLYSDYCFNHQREQNKKYKP